MASISEVVRILNKVVNFENKMVLFLMYQDLLKGVSFYFN